MAKKTRKLKDLDPKAKGKGVRGGWSGPGKYIGSTGSKVGNSVNKTLDAGVNRTLNDPR